MFVLELDVVAIVFISSGKTTSSPAKSVIFTPSPASVGAHATKEHTLNAIHIVKINVINLFII
jgi:hypothetical protein